MGRFETTHPSPYAGPALRFFRALDALMEKLMWLAHTVLVFSALSFLYFLADREPPFALLSVEPAAARAGEVVTIRSQVRRDVSRNCSATFSRFLYERDGSRFDMGVAVASAPLIAEMDRRDPGRLTVKLQVPAGMAPGEALLVTSLDYACNPVHALWPIPVVANMPFTVLP